MDTSDTSEAQVVAPVQDTVAADAQNTASVADGNAPEATQVSQETSEGTQGAEVNADDTADSKLYAGKYKTVEDMEKAYAELNSKFTSTSQEKAQLARVLEEAFNTPNDNYSDNIQQDTYDDYSQESGNTSQTSKQAADTAVLKFVVFHPDADPVSMNEVMKNDPLVNQINSPEARLEYAYAKSQSLIAQKQIQEAQSMAMKQAQQSIISKQAAQVETARKAEAVDERSELQSKLRSNSESERKAAMSAYIKKFVI